MGQTSLEPAENSNVFRIIKALEAHRDKTGTGYKNSGQGGYTLRVQLLDKNQQPFGPSVVYHANGHGYSDCVVVFNRLADDKNPAKTVTRHYHRLHLLKMRVMNSTMKATPTDCDVENIGNDVLAFLKSGTLPKTLELG